MIRHTTLLLAVGLSLVGVEHASAQKTFLQRTAAEWAGQLRSPSAAVRRNAAFGLGQMGVYGEKELPALKRALRLEKDAKARESMVCAAGEINAGMLTADPEIDGILIESLQDSDKLVRRSAACALGLIANKTDAVRTALAAALKDPEQLVRQNAAWALGRLDEKALPALEAVLADATADSLVKRDAANALFAVGAASPEKMRPAMQALLAMCNDPDAEVRKSALIPLVRMVASKDDAALPILKKTLNDPDPEVKRYAALALSNIGGQAAVDALPILVETLRNGEPHLKQSAAVALHNIGKTAAPAVPDLIKALQDTDPDLRKHAALALGGIGEAAKDAVPTLVQIMANPAQPIAVRVQAAEALTKMKDLAVIKERIPDVLKVLGNPDENADLRLRAAWLFNSFFTDLPTMEAAKPVMERLCSERDKASAFVRYHCASLLAGRFQSKAPDAALNALEEWLYDNSGKMYAGVDSKVGAQGVETKGNVELKTLVTGDSREMAVDALHFIGLARVRARPKLVEQLGVLAKASDTHKDLREKAQKLLKAIGK
jgi:HEAT repeat protein